MKLSAGINNPLCGWEWIEEHEIKKEGGVIDLNINHLDIEAIRIRVNRICAQERAKRRK